MTNYDRQAKKCFETVQNLGERGAIPHSYLNCTIVYSNRPGVDMIRFRKRFPVLGFDSTENVAVALVAGIDPVEASAVINNLAAA